MNRKSRLRIRFRTLVAILALCSVIGFLLTSRFRGPRIPSQEEDQAIRAAMKHLATMRPGKPDLVRARKLDGGVWDVKFTFILNPEPDGYRDIYTIRVDGQSRCLGSTLEGGGSY
jgi:hypothetical protein